MPKKIVLTRSINGHLVKVFLYLENRNNVRYSFGKKKLIFRIPQFFDQKRIAQKIEEGMIWAEKTVSKKPNLILKLINKTYGNIFEFEVMDQKLSVSIIDTVSKKNQINYYKGNLTIKGSEEKIHSEISSILSDQIKKIFLPTFTHEVSAINKKYFGLNYNRLSLKYNSSNWGSCSSKKNLNFSTRVLLLPRRIRRYIIIHELCHLLEMNHSNKFWKEVELRAPDYKECENFLSTRGHEFDF